MLIDEEVTPGESVEISTIEYDPGEVNLARGEEMGRFNMGSTVILILPPGLAEIEADLWPQSPVLLGQRLAMRRAGET